MQNGYTDTNPRGYSGEILGGYGEVRDGHLFGPAGGVTEAAKGSLDGYYATKRSNDAVKKARIQAAARVYADVLSGKLPSVFLQEAMAPRNEVLVEHLRKNYPGLYLDEGTGRVRSLRETMSVTDYQALYVDVLDRMYYGYYNTYPVVNKGLVKSHPLRDFRVVSRYLLDGVVSPLRITNPNTGGDAAAPWHQKALSGPVPQDGATFPTTNTAPIQYQPQLYQAGTAVNWRAFVNDDLGIFRDLSSRLAIAGNRGISKTITGFYVDANGPSATLYKTAYKNQIIMANGAQTNNPALSVQGIMDAMSVLAKQRDSGGDPILITGKLKLWYGPALYATANNIMNQLSVYIQNYGGTGNAQGFPEQFLQVNNWMIQNMDLVMDPYIPIVASAATGSIADTMWGIIVDPETQNRPTIEFGMLQGFETPQMFSKVPNTMRLGGGVDPTLGDFYSMDQEMKIITVMGGAQIDGRATVASTGAGV